MPWYQETKKDALICDNPRGADKTPWSVGLRMGKPSSGNALEFISEYIGYKSKACELKHLSNRTKRKQTSDYPSSGERKGNSLNLLHVIACRRYAGGVAGLSARAANWRRVTKLSFKWTQLESWTIDGDSPVIDNWQSLESIPSKSGHVKPWLNPPGPSGKAKYSYMTDSEPVPWGKDEKNRGSGVK